MRGLVVAVCVAATACSTGSVVAGSSGNDNVAAADFDAHDNDPETDPGDLARLEHLFATGDLDLISAMCDDWSTLAERASYAIFMDSANSGAGSFDVSFDDFKSVVDNGCYG